MDSKEKLEGPKELNEDKFKQEYIDRRQGDAESLIAVYDIKEIKKEHLNEEIKKIKVKQGA